MNVAASIPLLKPIVDLLFGKAYMGDTGHKSQGNMGFPPSSGVELGSRPTKTKAASTTTVILQSILGDDNDSQDSILGEGKSSREDQRREVKGNSKSTSTDVAVMGTNMRGIMRTDDVEITYSNGNTSASALEAEQRKREWV